MFEYKCENCGQLLEAENSQIGQRAKCPACGHVGVVPKPVRAEAVQGEKPRARLAGEGRSRGYDDEELPLPKKKSSGAMPIILIVVGVCFVCLLVCGGILAGLLLPAVSNVRQAAARMQESNNLKQLGIAMHEIHNVHGAFPQAVAFRSPEGKPLLSWRVMILPYIEQENLYRQFRLDEPWDSPHNLQLLSQMPKIYARPGDQPDGKGLTHYQVITGKGYLFDEDFPKARTLLPGTGRAGKKMSDITDGLTNTIMIVVAKDPVPWTKPEDIDGNDGQPIPSRLDTRFKGTVVGFADGSVQLIRMDKPEQAWKAALTVSGGEVVDLD